MALAERFMRLNDDGSEPGEAGIPNDLVPLRVRSLFAQVIHGNMTANAVNAVKTAFNIRTTIDANGKSDEQDWNAMLALVPVGVAERMQYIDKIFTSHILARGHRGIREPGFDTP